MEFRLNCLRLSGEGLLGRVNIYRGAVPVFIGFSHGIIFVVHLQLHVYMYVHACACSVFMISSLAWLKLFA